MEILKDMCRVCLKTDVGSNSFLDEVEYESYIKLSHIFLKVTNVEVSPILIFEFFLYFENT